MFWKIAPVLFVVLWAGGYSFAKLGLAHIEPLTMLAIRFGLAAVLLLPLLAIMRPPLPRDPAHWGVMALSGLLLQCVYFGLAYLAMKSGMNAGVAAIIMALQPALVTVLSPFVGEARGHPIVWVGLIVGFVGVGITVLDSTSGTTLVATLLAFTALLGITAATLMEKLHTYRTDPILGGLTQYIVGAVVLTPIALLTEHNPIDWHPNLLISFAYLVFGNSLISISLYVALVQRGSATQVSSLLFLVTPVALFWAWVILGEPITQNTLFGFALCLGGVYIVQRSNKM